MTNFAEPDVAPESGDKRYLLKQDFQVDAIGYLQKWEEHLESIYEYMNEINDYLPDNGPLAEENLTDVSIVVPAGFQFNGASIPDWIGSLFSYKPGDMRLIRSSLVHDWVYYNHQVERWIGDDLFYCMLREDEVNWSDSLTMWDVVRKWGKRHWRNSTSHNQELVDLCQRVSGNGGNPADYSFPRRITQLCCP